MLTRRSTAWSCTCPTWCTACGGTPSHWCQSWWAPSLMKRVRAGGQVLQGGHGRETPAPPASACLPACLPAQPLVTPHLTSLPALHMLPPNHTYALRGCLRPAAGPLSGRPLKPLHRLFRLLPLGPPLRVHPPRPRAGAAAGLGLGWRRSGVEDAGDCGGALAHPPLGSPSPLLATCLPLHTAHASRAPSTPPWRPWTGGAWR